MLPSNIHFHGIYCCHCSDSSHVTVPYKSSFYYYFIIIVLDELVPELCSGLFFGEDNVGIKLVVSHHVSVLLWWHGYFMQSSVNCWKQNHYWKYEPVIGNCI